MKEKTKKENQLKRRILGRIDNFQYQRRSGIRLDTGSVSPGVGKSSTAMSREVNLFGLGIGRQIQKNINMFETKNQS